jgi:hypothetical protein
MKYPIAFLILPLLTAALLLGQTSTTGQILGSVTDPTGSGVLAGR